jgi:peptidoglycan-associated lipoprotein
LPEKEEKMRNRFWIAATLLLVLPAFLGTVSCAKKALKKDQPMVEQKAVETTDSEAAKKAEEERLRQEKMKAEAEQRAREAARNRFEKEHVYFAFDSSALDEMAQETLRQKAQYLNDNPDMQVTVEGHCDERGTNDYNLALGDRRANSAKGFLVNLGVEASRLTTVSYGEERPLDPRSNEEAWAKNRRAQFVVQ